jgi:hypothetical protein
MVAPKRERELTFPEVDLSVNFYDQASGHLEEAFEEISHRVLGSQTFVNFPHPEVLKHECKTMFDLAHEK